MTHLVTSISTTPAETKVKRIARKDLKILGRPHRFRKLDLKVVGRAEQRPSIQAVVEAW